MTSAMRGDWTRALALFSLMAITLGPTAAMAQVPVCSALTLYGNAVNSGLCKSLSTNNLWVCDLTGSQPDVHSTFNATTALHITVRTANNACEGNATLGGNWLGGPNAGLTIAKGQPTKICGVDVQNYVKRFNDQKRMAAIQGSTLCKTAFQTAQNNGKISPTVANFYLGLCTNSSCP
ncbi:MAG: hypothetical protein ABW123_13905 [Cystobacter sp.]